MRAIYYWFVQNHVAANLLMLTIVVAGATSLLSIKQEVFPELEMDIISIQVAYLGATPAEVEEAVCVRIEEQIHSVDGVKRITSTASEGMGLVMVELLRGTEASKALDGIKAEVDRIVTFPEETEKPIITQGAKKQQAIDVVIFGQASEVAFKNLTEKIRDDLLNLPDISYATIQGTRPYEISIEVSEESLQAYGLTHGQISQAVKKGSLDLPGGSIRTKAGEILIRTKGQLYTGEEFGNIPVISNQDGSRVTLDQIATISDGFEEVETASYLDSQCATMVSVYRTGDQGVLKVTGATKEYVKKMKNHMPPGLTITTWNDRSSIYRGRMVLLGKNGLAGLVLVFCTLALALELRLAFWVTVGLVIAFLGSFWILHFFGVSLNMISMFAFIVTLGLVVDDAIVVGENIYAHREMGLSPLEASKQGTAEVGNPVILAVLTTVVAFLPLAFVNGVMGQFMFSIPVVVIAILVFSLIESLLILPAHLSTIKVTPSKSIVVFLFFGRIKNKIDEQVQKILHQYYRPLLELSLRNRGQVFAIGLTTLILTIGWIAGGNIQFTFMPKIDADNLIANLTLVQGATMEEAMEAVRQLESSLDQTLAEYSERLPKDSEPIVKHISTSIGAHSGTNDQSLMVSSNSAHLVEVNADLLVAELRNIPSSEMAARWRELCGPISGAVSLTFSADLFQGSKPIHVQLSSPDTQELLEAGRLLKSELTAYPGVQDISDSFREGKVEIKLSIKPEASLLGLTLSDLATQVRSGFYGDEAMRIQRGRHEVKVMIRYPENERVSLGNIEAMRIRTASGEQVPFSQVANVDISRGFASIERSDRKRVISITADVDQSKANADEIIQSLQDNFLSFLMADYPGLSFSMEGQQKEQSETLGSLGRGFLIALFLVYVLLAVTFKSYLQPILVMTAIPFGIVGAILGHLLMGLNLTLVSMFGVVALTGVVVNDSLILIDFINRSRQEGQSLQEALVNSGIRRFRPIMLTSITTFAGLVPLLLEKSLQAKFLVPMATSLGFGVMFSTLITLLLVPVSYSILEQLKAGKEIHE